jgi:heavy metal sensor kinase
VKVTSVQLRLALWNVGALTLVLAAFGGAIRYTDQVTLTASLDRQLSLHADRLLRRDVRRPPPPGFGPPGAEEWVDMDGRQPLPPDYGLRRAGEPLDMGSRHGPRLEFIPSPGAWGRGRRRPRERGYVERFGREWRPGDRGPGGGPPPPLHLLPLRLLDLQGRVVSLSGRITAAAAAGPWDRTAFARALRGRDVSSTITASGQPVRVLSAPVRRDGLVVGVLQLATPLVGVYDELARLSGTLMTLSPLALLAAALGGVLLTERALRPVRQITQAASQIGVSDLSERLPVRGKDEFSELAATFNGMLARLERAFTQLSQALEQQRRFTADASHELRTPLTIMKANTSLALEEERSNAEYRRALEAADRAIDTTTRIVQDLLLLARGDAGQLRVELRPTCLSEVLEHAVEPFSGARVTPIAVEVSQPSLLVLGDSHHLLRLFTNLLENAVRHTPPAGRITLTAVADKASVVVRVQDTGEGIPPEHLPHVRERFYRVDAARTRRQGGTGLGLSICQSIVEAHHGSLVIESDVGKSTTITVRLPRSVSDVGDNRAQPTDTHASEQCPAGPPRSSTVVGSAS